MIVEVIAIGDELLIGQTVNTNASWIGSRFSQLGADVKFGTVIRDEEAQILSAIDHALKRADVVIVTGGLGPTRDDITKYTLCKYFDTELEINEAILKHVSAFFEARGRKMLEVNVQQAAIPKKAEVLQNDLGTASGMWFDHNGKVLVSLPGVPYEMKHIMTERVFPRLINRFQMTSVYYRTIPVQGIGESYLAERIADIEDEIRANNMSLAYLPSPGIVRLRITSERNEENKQKIEAYFSEITHRLPQYVYSDQEETLAEVVGKLLTEKNATVGTIESCTGGAMAAELVSVSGASSYFKGSIISYANKIKADLVGVNTEDLIKHGAVSEVVAKQMAANGRERLGVEYCLSATGIAGPDGGSDTKPVGTVWIGIATPTGVRAEHFRFGDSRDRNIRMTILTALNLLRAELLGINYGKK